VSLWWSPPARGIGRCLRVHLADLRQRGELSGRNQGVRPVGDPTCVRG
jgi:hypothetical protein